MKFLLNIILIFLLLESNASASTPNCQSLKGQWINKQGSILTFNKIDDSVGSLSGSYISSSGTEGNNYPLIGWFNRSEIVKGKDNVTAMSFSVRWGRHGSITSWTGTCSIKNGNPSISAIWNLVRSNSDHTWDHMLTNHVTFTIKPK